MICNLKSLKTLVAHDLRCVLNYLSFGTPDLTIFAVLRRFLVLKRFNNFGGNPKIGLCVTIIDPKKLKLAGYAVIGDDVLIEARGGVTMGRNSGIASGSKIRTGAHIYSNPDIPFFDQGHSLKAVTIGEDVWIANNCFILPGTSIGDHSVIASCSVVSGVIPPYSIMAGNPARRVGMRKQEQGKET
jgi:acetyltransferase-like isoleucine patch superfamily enzyme